MACLIALGGICLAVPTKYTRIDDISEYGVYKGNIDNTYVRAHIQSFFPGEIEENFQVVKYAYRAKNKDTYGFEAYLEFRIDDRDEFVKYITALQSRRAGGLLPVVRAMGNV